jgi:hypothetical protein
VDAVFIADFVINVRAGIFGPDFRGAIWQASSVSASSRA